MNIKEYRDIEKNFKEFQSIKVNKNLPKDLKNKIKEFKSYLKSYDIESLRPEPILLKGDKIFNKKTINDKLTEITRYLWDFRVEHDGFKISSEDLLYNYNISVKDEDIDQFVFYRNVYSKYDISDIIIISLPGMMYVNLDCRSSIVGYGPFKNIDEMFNEISDQL